MQGYLAGVMKKLRLVNRTWLVALFASAILQLAAAKADDRPTIEPVPQISHSYGIRSAAFSPDGRRVLTGGWDGTIKLWDLPTGKLIRSLATHVEMLGGVLGMYSSEIISVAFSPDGRQALSGGADGTIELWELPTGKLVHRLKHSEDTGFYVLYVAFSADGRQGLSDANGRQVLSGSDDNTIKLWDASSGKLMRSFDKSHARVLSVAFSPDGRQVLSSHYWHDPVVKLWDAASGKLVRSFEGTSTTGKVAVSPDGRQVLSGGINGTMELWDSASGELVRTFAGHDHAVTSVTFSPDSKQVLSGSWDKTVKLWDAASGKLVRSFERHSDIVRSVAFSPQGKQVLSGSDHQAQMARQWRVAGRHRAGSSEGPWRLERPGYSHPSRCARARFSPPTSALRA